MGRWYNPWQGFFLLVVVALVSGCALHPPVCGLRPEYPEALYSFWGARVVFAEVDSLQPTLRWESFPRPQDQEADKEGLLGRIANVTYDLRIWRNDCPAEVAYSRQGLPTASHTIEDPLEPSAKYFWSIRARFELEGHPRVAEWGLSELPWPPGPSPCKLASMGRIPDPNYYRFKTPSK